MPQLKEIKMIKFRAVDDENNRQMIGIGLTIQDVDGIYQLGSRTTLYGEEVGVKRVDVGLIVAENEEKLIEIIKREFGEIEFKRQGDKS
jgi:hypothetical protein